ASLSRFEGETELFPERGQHRRPGERGGTGRAQATVDRHIVRTHFDLDVELSTQARPIDNKPLDPRPYDAREPAHRRRRESHVDRFRTGACHWLALPPPWLFSDVATVPFRQFRQECAAVEGGWSEARSGFPALPGRDKV